MVVAKLFTAGDPGNSEGVARLQDGSPRGSVQLGRVLEGAPQEGEWKIS